MKVYTAIVRNEVRKNNAHDVAQTIYVAMQKRINNALPSGSGFDNGCTIETAKPEKIVIKTSFHHMNDGGFYDGWTHHKVIIKPCLYADFTVSVTGSNRNGIKEHIADTFYSALDEHIEEGA